MSGQEKIVAELIRGLKHERDELRLQMHLAKKELQDEWEQLDAKVERLNQRYQPFKDAAAETADDVWDSLKLVGAEIRDGVQRMRKTME